MVSILPVLFRPLHRYSPPPSLPLPHYFSHSLTLLLLLHGAAEVGALGGGEEVDDCDPAVRAQGVSKVVLPRLVEHYHVEFLGVHLFGVVCSLRKCVQQ